MENQETRYKIKPCTKEEVESFNADFQEIIKKHDVEVRAVPVFLPDDVTGKFVVDSQLTVFKKVPLTDGEETENKFEPEPETE